MPEKINDTLAYWKQREKELADEYWLKIPDLVKNQTNKINDIIEDNKVLNVADHENIEKLTWLFEAAQSIDDILTILYQNDKCIQWSRLEAYTIIELEESIHKTLTRVEEFGQIEGQVIDENRLYALITREITNTAWLRNAIIRLLKEEKNKKNIETQKNKNWGFFQRLKQKFKK